MDGGYVIGDGLARGFHRDDRVGRVDQVAVTGADELTELFALILDLFSGGGLDGSDLGYWFRTEQRLGCICSGGVATGDAAAESAVIGRGGR